MHYTFKKEKVEIELLENRDISEDVEEIFEEDSEFSHDDEALASMEFFDEQSGEAERYDT